MKIIQNPWLRRGLYAEGVSVRCGHAEAIRSPLFLRLGAEKEGWRAGSLEGKMRDEKTALWDGKRGSESAETGWKASVPIRRKKLRFLGIPDKGKEPKKFRKWVEWRGWEWAVECSRNVDFCGGNAHFHRFLDKGKTSAQFRIRQVNMQKRKAAFILCTSNLKIAQISCTIQNRICMIRERKSNHENVFQSGQKGKMPIARSYCTVIL